ncbi:MAG TPA: ABC transporter transmembrane domain-containing protein [Chloroflexota bacterium]|nr:ABC transporter transmembrane domain-containing protein [Chloroflexota bacterium]
MYFDRRLFGMTRGVRGRVAFAAVLGLAAVPVAMWRLALTGQAMARVFAGESFESLTGMLLLIAGLVVLRSILQFYRDEVGNATAALMKVRVRGQLYQQVLTLGAGHFDQRRSGDAALALVDGVEQLDQFFGQYLPQLIVAFLTPLIIFAFMATLDVLTALVFLVFALLTLAAPAAFHRLNSIEHGLSACPGGHGRGLPRQHPGPRHAQGIRPEHPSRRRAFFARARALPQDDVGAGGQHRHWRHHAARHLRGRRAGAGLGSGARRGRRVAASHAAGGAAARRRGVPPAA